MSRREGIPSTTSHEDEEWAGSNANEDADHTPSESAARRLVEYSDSEDEDSCGIADGLASLQNGPLPSSAYDSDSLFIPLEENVESAEDTLEDVVERPSSPIDDDERQLFEGDERPIKSKRPSGSKRLSSSERSSDSEHEHASEIEHISKKNRLSTHNLPHAPKRARPTKPASAKRRAPAIDTENSRATKRAREIKAQVKNSPTMNPSPRPNKVLTDPENHAIKRMRQEENMDFTSIAQKLNEERRERGEPETMTAASVYSRFVRNCPRIAAAQGETGFKTRDYMYLRYPQKHPAAELPGAVNNPSGFSFGGNGAHKRPSDATSAEKELAGNVRHQVTEALSEQEDMIAQPEMTEALMEAVADVNDRFWDHVASVMEANTGKLFDKDVLKTRYNTFKW